MVVSPDPLSAVVLLSKPPEMDLCSFAMLVISILLVPALASKLTEAPNALVWLFERERVLKSFASLSFSAHATDMAIGYLKRMEEKNKKVKEDEFWDVFAGYLHPMLSPLVIEREVLFGFKSESKYNIALYFYDNEENCLGIVWRDCDSRLPQRNRKWKPGHGHVGLAFLHKEIKFCPDIRQSTELTPSYTQGDNENYRSFISIPILRCEDNGNVHNQLKPLGVLVLTSAQAHQFSKERDLQFLTIISKYLAIYLAAIDTFITHTELIDSTEQSRGEP